MRFSILLAGLIVTHAPLAAQTSPTAWADAAVGGGILLRGEPSKFSEAFALKGALGFPVNDRTSLGVHAATLQRGQYATLNATFTVWYRPSARRNWYLLAGVGLAVYFFPVPSVTVPRDDDELGVGGTVGGGYQVPLGRFPSSRLHWTLQLEADWLLQATSSDGSSLSFRHHGLFTAGLRLSVLRRTVAAQT